MFAVLGEEMYHKVICQVWTILDGTWLMLCLYLCHSVNNTLFLLNWRLLETWWTLWNGIFGRKCAVQLLENVHKDALGWAVKHTFIAHASKERSSFSSTTFSLILTFSVFGILFHVFNFRFFMRDHMLHLFDLILSSTKRHNIPFPITDCWQRSSPSPTWPLWCGKVKEILAFLWEKICETIDVMHQLLYVLFLTVTDGSDGVVMFSLLRGCTSHLFCLLC